jgi:hypothetical protein
LFGAVPPFAEIELKLEVPPLFAVVVTLTEPFVGWVVTAAPPPPVATVIAAPGVTAKD